MPDPGGAPPGDDGPAHQCLPADGVGGRRRRRFVRVRAFVCVGVGVTVSADTAATPVASAGPRSTQAQSGQARRLLSYLLDP